MRDPLSAVGPPAAEQPMNPHSHLNANAAVRNTEVA